MKSGMENRLLLVTVSNMCASISKWMHGSVNDFNLLVLIVLAQYGAHLKRIPTSAVWQIAAEEDPGTQRKHQNYVLVE